MTGFFRFLLVSLAFTLGTTNLSHAASFDCSKATTKTEIAICNDPELSALDVFMKNVFDASLKNKVDDKNFREDQRNWIEERDLCLSDVNCIKDKYRSQVSQSWSDACSSKVQLPSKLIDDVYWDYGTPYSGGDHSQTLGDITSTIDLYRSLNNLKPLEFRKNKGDYELYSRDPKKEILGAVENEYISKNADIQESHKYDLGVIYDIGLSVVDGRIDWWINPDTKFSDYSKKISILSQNHESLNWILSVMSASHLPWNIDWHLKYTSDQSFKIARKRMLQYTMKNFKNTKNAQWIAVASMFAISTDPEVEIIKDYFNNLVQVTTQCIQTDAEFLTVNMLSYELTRILGREFFLNHSFLMSDVLKGYAVERLFKKEVSQFFEIPRSAAESAYHLQNLRTLSKTIDNAYYLRKIGVGLVYLSPDIKTLISNLNFIINRHLYLSELDEGVTKSRLVDAKLMRALNVLDIDNLIEVSKDVNFGDSERKVLLNSALNRSFVLGQYNQAQNLLTSLIDYLNDDKKQKVLSTLNLDLPTDVSLAISILNMEEKTIWITNDNYYPDLTISREIFYKSGTDLNDAFLNGSFLDRDLNAFLMHPSEWFSSYSMCCRNIISRLSRYDDREGYRYHHGSSIGVEFDFNSNYSFGTNMERSVYNLLDKGELQNYSPKQGLARKLSEIIINWEKEEGTRWYRRSSHHDEIAINLAKIVNLQKRNMTGKLDGKYLGQIAYNILKKHYSDTKISEETKYWFYCEQSCR